MTTPRSSAIAAFTLTLLLATSARGGMLNEDSKLLQNVAIEQKPGAQVSADLQFRDEQGNAVRLGDYYGEKPILLHLVYLECPMLCNVATDNLIRTLRTLAFNVGDEFTVLSVSFDPREGPRLAKAAKRSALKRYDREGTDDGWHILTGEQDAIAALTDTVGFRYSWNERLAQYAHGSGIIVLTPSGQVSRYLNGVDYTARDIRFSLIEAAENRIGSVIDQAMLICYPYDPRTGRYGLAIQRILKTAGILTATLLGASIWMMLRHERRKAVIPPSSIRSQSSPIPRSEG